MTNVENFYTYARKNTSEQICVIESIMSELQIFLHSHNFMELSYICKGSAIHVVNEERIPIKEGDLFILSNDCRHTFEETSGDFNWINILFLPQLFDSAETYMPTLNSLFDLPYFKKDLERKIDTGSEPIKYIHLYQTDKSFRNIFKDSLNEYYNALPGYRSVLKHMLASLLIKIARKYMQNDYIKKDKSKESDLVTIIYNYINMSSSIHKIRREDIAQKLHIHPDNLGKLFKKKFGVNFSAFIKDMRLKYAVCCLQETDMNIREIMNFVGYQDSKSFYKSFKEAYNVTPAQFRKNYRLEKHNTEHA